MTECRHCELEDTRVAGPAASNATVCVSGSDLKHSLEIVQRTFEPQVKAMNAEGYYAVTVLHGW